MSTGISIGFSQHPDPQNAVLQACVQVKNQLNRADTDLIIVFASPQYIVPETQSAITRSLKPKHLIGSSAGGIILSNGVANRGIAIVGINSDEMHFGISAIRDPGSQDMHQTGFDLARQAAQDLNSSHREVFITFSQGIEENCSPFIRGIREILGGVFPVIGAISGDDLKYKKPSQLFQDQILHHSAVGLLLGGAFHLGLSCKHSFKPLGRPRTVTKVDGHILRTIDNAPAIEIYKHFLGDVGAGSKPAHMNGQGSTNAAFIAYGACYPLGFYLEESRQYLLRNMIDILQDGSIVCHGGIPQGAEVHLMISNKESCHSSAIQAAESIKASLADRPAKLVLIFESLARHKILGEGAFSEIQAVRDVLGATTPIAGMYSYGEIGPFGTLNNIKNIYLHNESILMLAVS